MIHDQADDLRQLVRQRALAGSTLGPPVPIVAVSGGKGGVGTTTIAANLAIALARQGRRAVFVDADLDHGGHAQLGQSNERGSVVDVLAGRRSVHEVLERGPSGIQVMSGAWASGEFSDCSPAVQSRFVADLRSLGPHAEVVVVDAGSSRGHFARRFWQSAGAVLVVTTTEASAIMECYAAIKVVLAGESMVPVHTLVNHASDAAAGDVHARIADACRRFLGLHAEAAGAVATCEPSNGATTLVFGPRTEAAKALDRVADALWPQLQANASRANAKRTSAA